jgi:hypothetical protein
MILAFALGIANIFTIHPLVIIFSIICLYVPSPSPIPTLFLSPPPVVPLRNSRSSLRL